MSQAIQEANGVSLTVEGGGVSLYFSPNAILIVSDSVYNSIAVQDALTAGDIIDADEVEAPPPDSIPHQFNNLFPVASYGTPTATELQLRFRESLGGFEDSDGNLYSAGSTFITFRVEMIDENGNFLLWEGLRGADPSDGSVVLTLTNDEKFKSGQSYPDTLGSGGGEYDLTGASVSDIIIVAEVSGGGSGIGNMQNIVTVAKSGAEYTLIQDGIDVASPSVQSGTAQAGAASTITLTTGASATDDYYNGMKVRLDGGTGDGQIRSIIDYDGTTKVATVDSDWDTNPDATSTYNVKSIATVLVFPGEYDEAITLKDCVDIVAVDRESVIVLQEVQDNGVVVSCYLSFTIESASVKGLDLSHASSDVVFRGNISGSDNHTVDCDGAVVIHGDVSWNGSAINKGCIRGTGTITVHGNLDSTGDGDLASGTLTLIVYGDINRVSLTGSILDCDGTWRIYGNVGVPVQTGTGGDLTIEGDVTVATSNAITCGTSSTMLIHGDVTSSGIGTSTCVAGSGTLTIHGNVSQLNSGVGADAISATSGADFVIDGNVKSVTSYALTVYSGGACEIKNGTITTEYDNASGHAINQQGGTIILRNVGIICTHASANSIYAPSAQDVYCMGVWANRDDNANITQMITGGFTYDANVQ